MAQVRVGRGDAGTVSFHLTLEVASLEQLSTLLARLGQVPNVLNVVRETGSSAREKQGRPFAGRRQRKKQRLEAR